ncbi:MAG: hypothetical protein AAF824_18645 [Bacteroidota bacterium]
MRTHLFILLQLAACVCIYAQKTPTYYLENSFQDYIPISPIEYEQKFLVIGTDGNFDTLTVKQLAEDKGSILKFLQNEAVAVQISKYESSGKISYAPSSISGEKGSYSVIMDYVKFTTLKIPNQQNGCDGFAKVGIGLRVRASIETRKKKLNLGGLIGLGVQADRNKLTGTISIDVIGIESKEVTSLLPLPTEISSSSIQTVLQAMAAMKAQIYNPETRLYPQIVAVKKTQGECSVNDVLQRIQVNDLPAPSIFLTPQQQETLQPQIQQQQEFDKRRNGKN